MSNCPFCALEVANDPARRVSVCHGCGAEYLGDNIFKEGSYSIFVGKVLAEMASASEARTANAIVAIKNNSISDKEDVDTVILKLANIVESINTDIVLGMDRNNEVVELINGIEKISAFTKSLAKRGELSERLVYRLALMEDMNPDEWLHPPQEIPNLAGELDDIDPETEEQNELDYYNSLTPEEKIQHDINAEKFRVADLDSEKHQDEVGNELDSGEHLKNNTVDAGLNEPFDLNKADSHGLYEKDEFVFETVWNGKNTVVEMSKCGDDLHYNVMDETGNSLIEWNDESGRHSGLENFSEEQLAELDVQVEKVNPWAVCTANVGRDNKDKYERCVMDVKHKQGMSQEEGVQGPVMSTEESNPADEASELSNVNGIEDGDTNDTDLLAQPIEDELVDDASEEHEEKEKELTDKIQTKAEKAQEKVEKAEEALETLKDAVSELSDLEMDGTEEEEDDDEEDNLGDIGELESEDEDEDESDESEDEETKIEESLYDSDSISDLLPGSLNYTPAVADAIEKEKDARWAEKNAFDKPYEFKIGDRVQDSEGTKHGIVLSVNKDFNTNVTNYTVEDSDGIVSTWNEDSIVPDDNKLEEMELKKTAKGHDLVTKPKAVPPKCEATGEAPTGHVVGYVSSVHHPEREPSEQWTEEETPIPFTQAQAEKEEVDENGVKVKKADNTSAKGKNVDKEDEKVFKKGRPNVKDKLEEITRFNGYRVNDNVKVPGYSRNFKLNKITQNPVKFHLTEGEVSITLDPLNDSFSLAEDKDIQWERTKSIMEDTREVWENMEKKMLAEGCNNGVCAVDNISIESNKVSPMKSMFVATTLVTIPKAATDNEIYAYIKNNNLHQEPKQTSLGHLMSNFQNSNADIEKIYNDAVSSEKNETMMVEVDSSYGFKSESKKTVDITDRLDEGYETLKKLGIV